MIADFEDSVESDLTVLDLLTGGEGLLAAVPGRGLSSVFSCVSLWFLVLYLGGWPSNEKHR